MTILLRIICYSIFFWNTVEPIDKRVARKIISWDFYRHAQPKDGKYLAQTKYQIRYRYAANVINSTMPLKVKFSVTLSLDTNQSFFDNANRHVNHYLLNHEQGHVDIGCIYANRLLDSLNNIKFYVKDIKDNTARIYKTILNKAILENERYDEETAHSENRASQKKWNQYFEERLRALSIDQ